MSRSRGSRIITGIVLLAAGAAVSAAMLGVGGVLAEVRQSPAIVSAVPLVLAEHTAPPLAPLAKRSLRAPRFAAAAGARLLPPVAADGAFWRASLAGLLGGLTAGSVLGWWLLDFARRNSRTRGQPRMGVLVY